tara:strand:- start:2141 stop:3499 length:1359 start_codon:yes stop_codon:yes gene_type:complete
MPADLSSARKKYYDDLWENTPTAKVVVDGKETDAYLEVPWKSNGESEYLAIKEIPIDIEGENGLWYNADNTRLLTYRRHIEETENRKLSSENANDRAFLEDKLLNNDWYYSQATKDLKTELVEVGQREAAIISNDGIIWNANRRIAVRQQLFKETGGAEWNRVHAVRLPPMAHPDLKKLEHRLQMQKEFKADYGSVNLRLRCRQALADPIDGGDGWSMAELMNSFNNRYKKTEILKYIDEIELVDQFLVYIQNPSDYTQIQSIGAGRGMEIFVALNDQLKWERNNPQNSPGESLDGLIENVKYIGFGLIHHPKSTYKNIRNFRDILRKEITRKSLIDNSIVTTDPASLIPSSGGVAPQALTQSTLDQEMKNLEDEQNVYDALSNTPTEVFDAVLKKLKTIDPARITPEDGDLRRNMITSLDMIEALIQKPEFNDAEKEELTKILESMKLKIK